MLHPQKMPYNRGESSIRHKSIDIKCYAKHLDDSKYKLKNYMQRFANNKYNSKRTMPTQTYVLKIKWL